MIAQLVYRTGWMMRGSNPGRTKIFFPLPEGPYRLQGPQIRKYQTYLPRVKRPGRGADHTSPSSAEVKNEWSYTSTPFTMPLWRVE